MESLKRNGLLFIGGDVLQLRAINRINEQGVKICVTGFDDEDTGKIPDSIRRFQCISDCDGDYDAVVLPLPYTTDGETVNAPQLKNSLKIEEIFQYIAPNTYVLAGKCDGKLRKLAQQKNIKLIDYFEREDLQILNAIPTAEGAIQFAMEELPYTLHGSKCLIIGNGRIGKILAKMLDGIGAEVTVAARKRKDLAMVYSYGYNNLHIGELYDNIGRFDVIFNTAPSLILDCDMLVKTRRDSLVIDLASKPGGVDFDAARRLGIKVIWALSLPGKVAPHTAGDIIGKTILNILDELEAKQ